MNSDSDIPPCDIKIDKDGVWYYKGAEMFRKDILGLFYQSLKREDSGRYIVEFEDERCYLDVEDTPFVVKAVQWSGSKNDNNEAIHISLNDQTDEKLDPDTLWMGQDNILYCPVKDKKFYARFSRAVYYQIANHIEYDNDKEDYFISLNGCEYYIRDSSLATKSQSHKEKT